MKTKTESLSRRTNKFISIPVSVGFANTTDSLVYECDRFDITV